MHHEKNKQILYADCRNLIFLIAKTLLHTFVEISVKRCCNQLQSCCSTIWLTMENPLIVMHETSMCDHICMQKHRYETICVHNHCECDRVCMNIYCHMHHICGHVCMPVHHHHDHVSMHHDLYEPFMHGYACDHISIHYTWMCMWPIMLGYASCWSLCMYVSYTWLCMWSIYAWICIKWVSLYTCIMHTCHLVSIHIWDPYMHWCIISETMWACIYIIIMWPYKDMDIHCVWDPYRH